MGCNLLAQRTRAEIERQDVLEPHSHPLLLDRVSAIAARGLYV
jgi:hypothetical protein